MSKGKMKKQLENLSNATPEYLVDELGKLRDEIKVLTEQEGFYKEAFKARIKEDYVEGEVYEANIAEQSRTSLDKASVLAEMGEDFIEKHSKTSTFSVIRTKKKA